VGDLDGDCLDDLIGNWAADPGVWVKYSSSGAWAKLDPDSPDWFSAGKMRSASFSGSGFHYLAEAIPEPPISLERMPIYQVRGLEGTGLC
jgi:hypothetical protein